MGRGLVLASHRYCGAPVLGCCGNKALASLKAQGNSAVKLQSWMLHAWSVPRKNTPFMSFGSRIKKNGAMRFSPDLLSIKEEPNFSDEGKGSSQKGGKLELSLNLIFSLSLVKSLC